MSGEFMQSQTSPKDAEEGEKNSGFMRGKVIRNCDNTRQGRVKVRLSARGGMEVWARVLLPDTGVYFIPQVNEEVMVGFHQGDGNEAFVMGRLWNDTKPPPRQDEGDPVNKRVILTPKKLEISFDDTEQSIVIKTQSGQHVTLKPDGIEIGADDNGSAVITLDKTGNISVKAALKISFSAPEIELQATGKLTLHSNAIAELSGLPVKINC
jgi:uncharacterized protein involved in type VI secretion and phage assembly